MGFDVVGPIRAIETIAAGRAIRQLRRLRRRYGAGRWRKRKGVAIIRLRDGTVHEAEIHYEAHGIGRREMKIKFPLLDSVMKKTNEDGSAVRGMREQRL